MQDECNCSELVHWLFERNQDQSQSSLILSKDDWRRLYKIQLTSSYLTMGLESTTGDKRTWTVSASNRS